MAGMRGEITAKMLILVVSLIAAVLVIILVFMITTNNLPPFLEAMERFFCKIPFLCGGRSEGSYQRSPDSVEPMGGDPRYNGGLEILALFLVMQLAFWYLKRKYRFAPINRLMSGPISRII